MKFFTAVLKVVFGPLFIISAIIMMWYEYTTILIIQSLFKHLFEFAILGAVCGGALVVAGKGSGRLLRAAWRRMWKEIKARDERRKAAAVVDKIKSKPEILGFPMRSIQGIPEDKALLVDELGDVVAQFNNISV